MPSATGSGSGWAPIRWTGAGVEGGMGAGVADGIDDRGNLVVIGGEGERLSLGSGEVTLSVPPQEVE
jgi:Biotin protein ligase C terminal domain